jgi:hypothetical protein
LGKNAKLYAKSATTSREGSVLKLVEKKNGMNSDKMSSDETKTIA